MHPEAFYLLGSNVMPAQGLATSTGQQRGEGGGYVLTSGHEKGR